MLKKILVRTLVFGLLAVVVIQFVPYGRDHTNPPIGVAPTSI